MVGRAADAGRLVAEGSDSSGRRFVERSADQLTTAAATTAEEERRSECKIESQCDLPDQQWSRCECEGM
jgi:hypothetical protein